jgi:sRNA-binding protein
MPRPQKTITITLTRSIPPSVTEALNALRERFPEAFRQPPVPLPQSILQTAHEALAEDHSKKSVRRALAHWCSRTDYLRAVIAEQARRVNLDGSDAGPVSEDQREAALRRLDTKGVPAQAPPPRPAPDPHPRKPAGDAEGPVVTHKKVMIRQKPKLSHRPSGDSAQRPKLSLRKRTPDKS